MIQEGRQGIDILLLDMGSSVPMTAKRLEQLGVSYKVASWDISPQEIASLAPKGIIMSGSGASVLDIERPKPNYRIYEMGIPIYGICYGFQVLTHQLGGQVIHSEFPEPGLLSQVTMLADCDIVQQSREFDAWFLHFDSIQKVPPGFQVVASSVNNKIAMAWDPERKIYGTLFHPERTDMTSDAVNILDSFVRHIVLGEHEQRLTQTTGAAEQAYAQAKEHILSLDVGLTETLDLSNLGLEKIPPELTRLKNLRKLYINRNPLKVLLPEIAQLKQLRTLAIYSGQLMELPEQVGELAQLEYLAVYGNLLQFLPKSIGNLSNLHSLAVDNNRLKVLPPEIGQLSKLLWLQLNHNEIASLPIEIAGLKSLNGIRLSFNKLHSLPSEFGQLSHVFGMSFNNNFLEELPDAFCKLTQVRFIEMENNRLKGLPEAFTDLQSLVVFRLKGNDKLKESPEAMKIIEYFSSRPGAVVTI